MLSHQQARNDIMGKKTIILNPTTEQKNGTDVVTFAEGVLPQIVVVSDGRKYIRWIFLCPQGRDMPDVRHPAPPSMQKQNRHISSNSRVHAPYSVRFKRNSEHSPSMFVVSRMKREVGWVCKSARTMAFLSPTRFFMRRMVIRLPIYSARLILAACMAGETNWGR